jgi:hypothetical protein
MIRVVSLSDGHFSTCYNSATLNIDLLLLKIPKRTLCERLHQAVGNSLRVLWQWAPPNQLDDAHLLVDTTLANTMYTTQAMFHGGLLTTPGALSFSRDMVLKHLSLRLESY